MNRDIIAFTKYKFNVYGNKDIRSGKDSAVVGIVGKSKSLDFPTMLIFWSLVRNSVVLAVYLLFSVACFLTVHEHSPQELKNIPCILVSSKEQRETEREYYSGVVGFQNDFLYAENLEEARLMVIGGQGFMPVEGVRQKESSVPSISRIPLFRGDSQMKRNYCAFWKKNNSGYYIEEFADMLKRKFV